MKHLKYYLSLLGSVFCIVLPVGFLMWSVYTESIKLAVVGLAVAVLCFFVSKAFTYMRIETRREVEYDEFGVSKSKGNYEKLSKAERNQIDLQKTARMEQIMNSSSIRKMTHKGSLNPQGDMDALIGLLPVKSKMAEMVARMQFDSQSRRHGKREGNIDSFSSRHMVFYGAPGTGKTTVARILTGFLFKYGYIKKNKCVEIDGNFLKAGSDTALKTELTIRQAFDGVLFIDEAYALMETGDGSGTAAIATLIKQMEDHRDRFILILAGYTNEMKLLLSANPGFASRVKEYIDFPDYSAEELREIFQLMAHHAGFEVDRDAYRVFDARILNERRLRSFGNARTVRNILDETLDHHSLNFTTGRLDEEDRFRLRGIDLSEKVNNPDL